jgi:hypothetical protein
MPLGNFRDREEVTEEVVNLRQAGGQQMIQPILLRCVGHNNSPSVTFSDFQPRGYGLKSSARLWGFYRTTAGILVPT